MSPRNNQSYSSIDESSSLLDESHHHHASKKMEIKSDSSVSDYHDVSPWKLRVWNISILAISAALVLFVVNILLSSSALKPIGPYRLVEAQEGRNFFSFYDFYDGPDSLGSAGYNMYVSEARAVDLDIAKVITEMDPLSGDQVDFVHMSSAPTETGPRDSIRLEGRRRFDHGLFILDVRHQPTGCGVWPAFWLTDEASWPRNGEVDILEGVNGQTVAKTALHTSDKCDMYAHVSPKAMTGEWEWVTGIPNQFTGKPDFKTSKPADNCWVMAQHQWANEGCTAVHDRNDTLGAPVNDNGGGVYALEWDPENNKAIKSWVFPIQDMPQNLIDAIDSAGLKDSSKRVMPKPHSWGDPYAFFAIGDGTGCSADHFKNMRIVFNLAYCGNVSGNRFTSECPGIAHKFNVTDKKGVNDPVQTCNAYIKSNPELLVEAYWKIRGVYVYERELKRPKKDTS
jgi:hypothetical protein